MKKVQRALPIIRDINLFSRTLFEDIKNSDDLGDFQLEDKGLLMLYKTDAAGEEETKVAAMASDLGLEVQLLDKGELKTMEPNVAGDVKGAVHYQCDRHMTPTEFMPKMTAYLKNKGVVFKTGEEVIDVVVKGHEIKAVHTSKGSYLPDEVVLAAGSWSGQLGKKLNLKLAVQPGKGYAIGVERETGISHPSILLEAKVAVTPMRGFTRFAGTMEFSGINDFVRKERVEAIAKAANDFYPSIEISAGEKAKAQTGMRPVSPDGLPYIGRSGSAKNLTIATGHAMMGWSLGPATGKLVSQVIDGKKTGLDLVPFSPDRKF